MDFSPALIKATEENSRELQLFASRRRLPSASQKGLASLFYFMATEVWRWQVGLSLGLSGRLVSWPSVFVFVRLPSGVPLYLHRSQCLVGTFLSKRSR